MKTEVRAVLKVKHEDVQVLADDWLGLKALINADSLAGRALEAGELWLGIGDLKGRAIALERKTFWIADPVKRPWKEVVTVAAEVFNG